MGWAWFFAMTSVVGLPALLLFPWVTRSDDLNEGKPALDSAEAEPEDPVPS
jgi:hypothetical protein